MKPSTIAYSPQLAESAPPRTSSYQLFLAERNEILRHKWFESEKRSYDVGYEEALVDWVFHHREQWKKTQHSNILSSFNSNDE